MLEQDLLSSVVYLKLAEDHNKDVGSNSLNASIGLNVNTNKHPETMSSETYFEWEPVETVSELFCCPGLQRLRDKEPRLAVYRRSEYCQAAAKDPKRDFSSSLAFPLGNSSLELL